jgi:hypothetical protein
MARKRDVADDEGAGPVRDKVPPPFPRGVRHRRRYQFEVLCVIYIGEDDQFLAMVLNFVLDARPPWFDQTDCCRRIVPVEEPNLGRLVVARAHEDVGAGLRQVEIEKKPGVALLKDHLIV